MQLHIPQPCQENWQAMTPAGQGKFCGSCQKTVIDFSLMSDEEVKNYLLEHRNEHTCGRFRTSQVGRPLEDREFTLDAKWFGNLPPKRQLFYAFALFFVLGIQSCRWSSDNGSVIHNGQKVEIARTMGKPQLYNDSLTMNNPVVVADTPCRETDIKGEVQIIEPPEPMIQGGISIYPNQPDTTIQQ